MRCGVTSSFILGLYFSKEVTDGDLKTCIVTSARYLDMLIHYAIPKLQRQNVLSEVVCMQASDPPHVGSSVKRLLSQQFVTELSPVISRFRGHQGLLISHQWIPGCGNL